MHTKMQNSICFKMLLDPLVKGDEGMRRREAFFKEQPHRIAFVSKTGLETDKDVPKFFTKHKNTTAISLYTTRRRAPLRFHLT